MNIVLRFLMIVGMLALATIGRTEQISDGRDLKTIVAAIQRADFEGDRLALRRLYSALEPTPGQPFGDRRRYWRGFALWRSALNGFNDGAKPTEIRQDLQQAIREFEEELRFDPAFSEANVGIISALQALAFLSSGNDPEAPNYVKRFVSLLQSGLTEMPDNPRFLWVYGASLWYELPGQSAAVTRERREKAMATYKRALGIARASKSSSLNPVQPNWGEAELLMNLAWSSLNGTSRDLPAAENYAAQALRVAPNWHYVKDILSKQIKDARN